MSLQPGPLRARVSLVRQPARTGLIGDAAPPVDKPTEKAADGRGAATRGVAPASGAAPAMSRDARIRELESKSSVSRAVIDLKAAPPPPAPPPVAAVPAAAPPTPEQHKDDPLHGIVISGYLQAQLENHEDSEDQLRPGGAPLNQNRFLIRRGRLRVEREWEYSAVMLEIDGNTNERAGDSAFQGRSFAPLSRGTRAPTPPMVKVAIELFDTPFGYEMLESPRNRFFMERSLQSRAFFPTEPDLGVRLSGQLGWFRYAFAVQNGEPLGTSNFAAQDPNNHKDFIARWGRSPSSRPSRSRETCRFSMVKGSSRIPTLPRTPLFGTISVTIASCPT